MSADLFAGTKIEPGALVQTLDLDAASGPSAGRGERGGLRACGPEQGSVALHASGRSLLVEKVRFTQMAGGREETPRVWRRLRRAPSRRHTRSLVNAPCAPMAFSGTATLSQRQTRAAVRHQTRCHGPSSPALGPWRGGHWLPPPPGVCVTFPSPWPELPASWLPPAGAPQPAVCGRASVLVLRASAGVAGRVSSRRSGLWRGHRRRSPCDRVSSAGPCPPVYCCATCPP